MRKELLIGIAVGIGAIALLAGASLGTVLIGAVILACPLMMMSMHHGTDGGHSANGAGHGGDDSSMDSAGIRK